ncbi:hypothetical protein GIY09_10975 [Aerococcaceae bacterium WS4759]|uniref:Tetratricopeptide repeat protein n=1 Tax=Fundicoccus ignavus TaxID=2664442 RepID=A0A6I2GGX7_9LACT|nr:hypothetical protein [Fundicoccus ignavus]MRI86366.1 hypothetical protein [Fundicoccus ignavus]
MNPHDLKKLYKENRYVDVIELVSQFPEQTLQNEWDYFYYTQSFYKLKKYDKCLEVYKNFRQIFPKSSRLDSIICWSLYHSKIKQFDSQTDDLEQLQKQVDFTLERCSQVEYSPFSTIILKFVDILFDQNNINYLLALKYLATLDNNKLNDHPYSFANKEGKMIVTPSDREKWFTKASKALENLQFYTKCIECVDAALSSPVVFQNNNEYWLSYRKAKCLYQLGELFEAESLLLVLTNSFKNWNIYHLLFKIYRDTNRPKEALNVAALASTFDQFHKARVGLYSELATFYLSYDMEEQAELQIKLIRLIRIKEGWRSDKPTMDYVLREGIDQLTWKEVSRLLNIQWQTTIAENKHFLEGTIRIVFPHGQSGFIIDENGKSYYFSRRDFMVHNNDIKPNQKVKFTLTYRVDKKDGENKPNATDIMSV